MQSIMILLINKEKIKKIKYTHIYIIAQWTLPNIILVKDIDMFSTNVPISANCLFVYCLLHLCIRMFIVFFCVCNINHCNNSAPCWDLDWTIQSYLICTSIQQKVLLPSRFRYSAYKLLSKKIIWY